MRFCIFLHFISKIDSFVLSLTFQILIQMNRQIQNKLNLLKPFSGILQFVFLLFFFHFSWKIAIDGDRDGNQIFFFGEEIIIPWIQNTACSWLTEATSWFVRLFPNDKNLLVENLTVYFPDGGIYINIFWGCTGIKQMFIFAGIMLFYRSFYLTKKSSNGKYAVRFRFDYNKLWYIPLGCILLTVYNVVRIGSIVLLTKGHPERFEFLHDELFRWIYYGIIFLLWVIWEEVFFQKKNKKWKQEKN